SPGSGAPPSRVLRVVCRFVDRASRSGGRTPPPILLPTFPPSRRLLFRFREIDDLLRPRGMQDGRRRGGGDDLIVGARSQSAEGWTPGLASFASPRERAARPAKEG